MLEPGQPAPSFALPDADMQEVCLSEFKGKKNVVLYFYLKDGTPGCTLVTTATASPSACSRTRRARCAACTA
jgi:peroxiredoxin Q/BCP